ncbi:MAG: hypothetical protein KIH67_002785 [Candidatus Moranbacteria bacterium]|nr:hypothetical protein [Candidatus Moranbacteria bacterium]
MQTLIVFTTKQDASRELLFTPKIQAVFAVQIFFYEHFLHGEALPLFHSEALVYLRDPFTSDIPDTELRPLITKIFAHFRKNSFIDHLATLEDVYLEDKWLQYEQFKAFMPPTSLASATDTSTSSPIIYKKRISSRSRHIQFVPPVENKEDYIAQVQLPIKEEYRVVEVQKEILPIMLIKSHKTTSSKVHVIAKTAITPEIQALVRDIQSKHSFDLVGYDIALTEEDSLFLIEVNRSPQILAYQREAGLNIFEKLLT